MHNTKPTWHNFAPPLPSRPFTIGRQDWVMADWRVCSW